MTAIERYLQRGVDARTRQIVTPEGVPLRFTLASGGERAAAFMLDLLFLVIAIVAVAVVLRIAGDGAWSTALGTVAAFVLRNFYFVICETRWQGRTPGKRIVGTRVVDARGGQLEAGSILVRNLVREIEVWQPLGFLLVGEVMWPEAPAWAKLVAWVWLLIFALMPLFNRDRLRIGDLLAGTWVVADPKTMLLPDLADARASAPPGWAAPAAPAAVYAFSPAQLGVYGIYELQVLEGVLRSEAGSATHYETLAAVAGKIHAKIGYQYPVPPAHYEQFLRDFYLALRAHLEKRLLFGQRREDKHAR